MRERLTASPSATMAISSPRRGSDLTVSSDRPVMRVSAGSRSTIGSMPFTSTSSYPAPKGSSSSRTIAPAASPSSAAA
ncbi:hypothetical protein [Streptomyces gilvus]|uniref:hypothetical protein n=1 Tax=Streptomyces gilvus TaxID=2920937 RepID=UPI001F0E85D8|nr:hypothetical protein [Streptomyces sp. CME 23]MCH5673611.1 hypothetical protein [Streptomyces sp. CME 23]